MPTPAPILSAVQEALAGGQYLQALTLAAEYQAKNGIPSRELLGVEIEALQGLGRHAEAVQRLEQLISREGESVEALLLGARSLALLGRLEDSIRALYRVTVLSGEHPVAWRELSLLLSAEGHAEAALSAFSQATRFNPDDSDLLRRYANLLHKSGRLAASREMLERAVRVDPENPDTHFSLGMFHLFCGSRTDAVACFRRALSLAPHHEGALVNLGVTLQRSGACLEAVDLASLAISLNPQNTDALLCRGWSAFSLFRVEEAMADFRAAIEGSPQCWLAHDALLLAAHYDEAYAPEGGRALRRYGQSMAAASGKERLNPGHPEPRPVPDRRLRIGYLSPDFRRHSVAFFITPVLAGHDRNRVEVFCYANVERPDEMTRELIVLADHWRNILPLSDEAAARCIAGDNIDILIDLAGHTAGNRLPVMALKPAPVQVSWLGYPDRTGLDAVDYRLTDEIADPQGRGEQPAAEEFFRLRSGFLCYRPAPSSPPSRPPAVISKRNEGIRFASFNNHHKLSPGILALWSQILLRVPGSSLLIKAAGLEDTDVKQALASTFLSHGVPAGQLLLQGRTPDDREHLRCYYDVDIALDPYPYHGTTTTFEALYMGVPVISLAGTTHASRVGCSILSVLRREELLAESDDDYLAKAVALAGDLPRLQEYHRTFRGRLEASPFMDEPGFCRKLESAYAEMWSRYCAGRP